MLPHNVEIKPTVVAMHIDNTKWKIYRKISNISRALSENKIIDRSSAVGASPVGAAPIASSLWT